MWREDCYRIDVPPGEGLKIKIDVDGYRVRTSTHANCSFDSYRTSLETNEGSGAPYEHYFVAPEGPQFILIGAFIRSDRPYQISLEAVSAAEWAQWQESVQLARIQDQQRRQQNSGGLFGALVRGAAMGVSGIDAPLMNPDGSAPNTLDVLNAANAELAYQNSVAEAELNQRLVDAAVDPHAPSSGPGQAGQAGQPSNAPVVAAAPQRAPLHYSCNVYDSSGDVAIWSHVFSRPAEGHGGRLRALEAEFGEYVRTRYAGTFGQASCWTRDHRSEADATILSGKQGMSANYPGRRHIDDAAWVPQAR